MGERTFHPLAMQLPVIYSQRDPRWAQLRLGYSSAPPTSTIHDYGCYLTCFAMLATHYGHPTTPRDLNVLLASRGLFLGHNLVADQTLGVAFPDISYGGAFPYRHWPANLNRLQHLLSDPATSVVLELDFNHTLEDGVQTHFVVALSCDGHHVTIADPWYGAADDITTHYGPDPAQVIQKLVVYHGPVPAPLPAQPTTNPTPEEPMTPDQRAILEKMATLNASSSSIDTWLSKIGRAVEIGRTLQSTRRLLKSIRPLSAELAALAD